MGLTSALRALLLILYAFLLTPYSIKTIRELNVCTNNKPMENIKILESLSELTRDHVRKLTKALDTNESLLKTIDKMHEALTELRKSFGDSNTCKICYVNKRSAALNCGHMTCTTCANKCLRAQRCPFCRKATTEFMRVFDM